MTVDMIAFDADDTLWHMEKIFKDAQEEFAKILAPYSDTELIQSTLYDIETGNIAHYGYGYKSYTLSMIETALVLSDGEIGGRNIEKILDIGKTMLSSEVVLIPGVKDTLELLSEEYPLMVITKGDLLEQTSKVNQSGLSDYFSRIEVVSHKTPDDYRNILKKIHINPENFVMVGNSLPADIQPVLSLGGIGIHVHANTTWAHDLMDDFDTSQENFYELDHIGQLRNLITKLL